MIHICIPSRLMYRTRTRCHQHIKCATTRRKRPLSALEVAELACTGTERKSGWMITLRQSRPRFVSQPPTSRTDNSSTCANYSGEQETVNDARAAERAGQQPTLVQKQRSSPQRRARYRESNRRRGRKAAASNVELLDFGTDVLLQRTDTAGIEQALTQ